MPLAKRILCPVDFSGPSDEALAYADELAETLGAELSLVHVYQLPFYPFQDGTGYGEDLKAQIVEELQAAIDKRAASIRTTASVALIEGAPPVEIARAAETYGADLIVMGTHGRSGLDRLLIGSVAERVVRSASVPVITIPRSADAA